MSSNFALPLRTNIHSHKFSTLLFILTSILLVSVSSAYCDQLSLAWDANNPVPQGYRVYQRAAGQPYNYNNPVWPTDSSDHTETTCTISNLTPGTTYYFVVRAYVGSDISGDSNEISYTVPSSVTLSSITISGLTQMGENSSTQYTCTANYSDGSTADITSSATWSENAAATSISVGGLLTAGSVSADTTVTITASYGGKSDTHSVTVINAAPTLSSITISGATQVNENSNSQYTCTAHYSDGSTAAVTGSATWSENAAATSISVGGLLTAGSVSADTTVTITASYGGRSDTQTVTVKNVPPTLSSITIGGATQVNENSSSQYTVTAHYSDGSTSAVTSGVTWSENSTTTSISVNGLLTAANVSTDTTVTITASYGGKSDTHTVTVKNVPPTLSSITIGGATQVNENSSSQYTVTAHYSDGSTSAVTSGVTWSENSTTTSISGSGLLTAGNVTGDTAVTLTASYGGKSDTHSVTVKNVPPTLSSITIGGATQVNENSSSQYTVTAHNSDGSTSTVTSGVTWSENSTATTISASGLLTAGTVTGDTPVTITASYSGKSDTHSLTVKKSAAQLTSLTISGPTQLDEGSGAQFTCTAHYSDNKTANVTDSVTWSENSSSATITAAGYFSAGTVQNAELVTVSAAVEGKQASFSLTINNSNPTHTLTVQILGSGTVQLDPPGGTYDHGTVVTLTAEADYAWAFDGWAGSVADVDAGTTTVVMDDDISLSVTFLEDTDLDSVPNREESGMDGLDTNYDGNNDGIADYLQSNVASLHTKDYQNFVTLSTPEPGRITECSVTDTATLASAPPEGTLPLGLIAFKIENLAPGADTTMTIHLPAGSTADTFYKFGATIDDPTPHWYEFNFDEYSGTGAVIDADVVTLYLKDGQRGDDDLVADGAISDPGGPAILQVEQTPTPGGVPSNQQNSDTSSSAGSSSGCFIDSITKLF